MEKWSSPNRPQQQCRVLYSTEKKTVNNEKDFEGEASSRNWNHHEIQFCQAQQQKPRATQESRTTCDLRRNGGARNFQYLGRGKSNTTQVHVNTQLTTHQIRSEAVIQEKWTDIMSLFRLQHCTKRAEHNRPLRKWKQNAGKIYKINEINQRGKSKQLRENCLGPRTGCCIVLSTRAGSDSLTSTFQYWAKQREAT